MNIRERVNELVTKYGQNDQRTDAWHSKRGEMLTASEIWKTVKDASPASRHEIVLSKLVPRDTGSGGGARALVWGTQFEPIAKQIYETLHGVKIVDTTCIPHPEHTFLGASPDGILVPEDPAHAMYGHLVEFKCPISREFDDTTDVPSAYVHQMQLQMACSGLDVCEYAEFKFKTMTYSEWISFVAPYKSVYIVLPDGTVKYKHYEDTRTFSEWKDAVLGEDTDMFQVQLVFWALTKHKFQTVHKDPEWMATHLPYFQETWERVQKHRAEGSLPEHPREKTTLVL